MTEPAPSCPCCHHAAQTWAVCHGCLTRVDQQLADIVELHALASLPEYLVPAWSSTGGVGPIGGSHEPPIGIDVAALDIALGEHALGVLEGWERWWRETMGLACYGDASSARVEGPRSHGTPELASTATSRNLSGTVAFLRARWPIAATLVEPPPDEFASEVRALHSQAMTALRLTAFDRDPDPDAKEPWDWTIRCPRDIDDQGTICGHRIGMRRQPATLDGHPPQPITVNCDKCGEHWDTRRLINVAIATGVPVDMSLRQVMDHYGCSVRTVRRKVAIGVLSIHRGRYRIAGHSSERMNA